MMTEKEAKAVREVILSLYSMFHRCGLRASEITATDRKRGLKGGQLCDDCIEMTDAHMRQFSELKKD